MGFAVRVYDNGGGAAEPRIRVDTIYVLSQERNWSNNWSRIGEGP
jgi:hypothetical protein